MTRVLVGSSLGGWIALEMAVRSQSTARPARADRLARGQVRRPRGARHRRHLRPAGRRGAAPHLCRPGAFTSPITQARRPRGAGDRARPRGDLALRLEAVHARPGAGRIGCTASPARRWCCGARRTASSRPPMASVSPPRCRTHASSGSPRAAHYPQIEQPDAVAAAIERFASATDTDRHCERSGAISSRHRTTCHRDCCVAPLLARVTFREENGK